MDRSIGNRSTRSLLNSTRNSNYSSSPPVSPKNSPAQGVPSPTSEPEIVERKIILTPSELDEIKDLYDQHAPLQTHAELQALLSTVGIHLLDEDVVQVSEDNGFENRSLLTLETLVWIMDDLKRDHLDRLVDDIHEAFTALSGGTDAILADDFREVAKNFKLTVDVEKLIEEADEDGSGEIEFDEFETMINMIGESLTPQPTPAQPALDAMMSRSQSTLNQSVLSPTGLAMAYARKATMYTTAAGDPPQREAPSQSPDTNKPPRGILNFMDLGARETNSQENSSRGGGQPSGQESAQETSFKSFIGHFAAGPSADYGGDGGSALRGRTKAEAMRNCEGGAAGGDNSNEASVRQSDSMHGKAFSKAKLLKKTRDQITVTDPTTGAKKVLKLPAVATDKDPSRLYNSKAPQWTVNYSNFMKK